MAAVPVINNYADLQNAILDYCDRPELTTQVQLWIQLTEAKIKRILRRTTVRTSVTINGDQNALPSAVAELRSVRLVTGNPNLDLPLDIGTNEMLSEFRANHGTATGRPQKASVFGTNQLMVAPTPDSAYTAEIFYYQGLTPLTVATPVNAVITEAPDLYLWGALTMAEPWLKNDDRMPMWKSLFDEALQQLNDVAEREEYGGSLTPMRLPVVLG